jgi:hypothetical protein
MALAVDSEIASATGFSSNVGAGARHPRLSASPTPLGR